MIDYDPDDWRSHLFDIQGSVAREIAARVSMCVLFAVLVVLVNKHWFDVGTHGQAHTYVGIVLGMLLVFRTNASYDRFWEGRRLWGSIINDSRSLARGALVFLAADRELAAELVRWTIAFPCAAMNSLRSQVGLGPTAERLPAEAVQKTLQARHVPMAVTMRMTAILREARDRGLISDIVMVDLERIVQRLTDYLGGCERIHRTPLPFAYVVHLRRALILYCYTVPFAFVGGYGWLTVPATLMVGYVFFGIEEIGVEIEDPFGVDKNDLPLDRFCATIERDLEAVLAAT